MKVFPSEPPDAIHLPSGESFAQFTAFEWFLKVCAGFQVLKSQIFRLVSPEPEINRNGSSSSELGSIKLQVVRWPESFIESIEVKKRTNLHLVLPKSHP